MDRLRLGIVGAGVMGGRIGSRVANGDIAEFALAGVADVDASRARQLAQELETSAHDSIENLISKESPEVLYIATPDHLHLQPCLIAAGAGIPFLVEKPLATTVPDAEQIVAAVAAAGITAEVNFSNRWNPPFVTAKEQIVSGSMGDFVTLFARLNNTVISPTQNLSWASDTTSAWFLLSHCFDLAYWLHGRKAASVYASGVRGVLDALAVNTWDSIHAIVRYEDGTDGSFESVWILPRGQASPVEFTFRYVGRRGIATIDTSNQSITLANADRTSNPITLNWTPQRFRALAISIRSRTPVVTLAAGLENVRILVALHKSLDSGHVEVIG